MPVAVLGVSVTPTYSIHVYKYKKNQFFFLVELYLNIFHIYDPTYDLAMNIYWNGIHE